MNITFQRHGGVHQWNLTLTESYEPIYVSSSRLQLGATLTLCHKWFNATTIEYAPAILCTKLTILLLYRRVFLPKRWSSFDIVLRVFMVVSSVFYLSTVPAKIWECIPRAKLWNHSLEGRCIHVSGILNADGLFNTLSDFLILIVPIKALWKLQIKTPKRIGIAVVFTVGLM